MTFKAKLYNILEDLNKHKRSKNDIMQDCISSRLNNNFNNYKKELENSLHYINIQNELSVMKKI